MQYNLKRFFYSCFRWGQSHGFGVQSPFAYNFIKKVVRDTNYYNAYAVLTDKYPNQETGSKRLLRFYLRLANYLHANVIVTNNLKSIDIDYFKAGCNSASLFASNDKPNVVLLQIIDDDVNYYEKFLEENVKLMSEKSVLIIEDIQCNKLAKSLWHNVVCDNRVGVTFDLYDCGVAFFNLKMHKTNYKLMLK